VAWHTRTDTQDGLEALEAAADRFDRPLVEAHSADLVGALRADTEALTDDEARRVLRVLRRHRYLRALQRVADALVLNGHDTPRNRRLYAQALIDQEAFTAALSVLAPLRGSGSGSAGDPDEVDRADEGDEAAGLVGRVHKQLYVLTAAAGTSTRRAEHLERAVAAYHAVGSTGTGQHLWHEVNVVALLLRAAADGVPLRQFPDPRTAATELAGRVLGAVQAAADPDVWQRATALEACLALRRYGDARAWLQRYVEAPDVGAFELGSTLRQLEEVWGLDTASPPGDTLLPLLKSELLRRDGGRVTVSASELAGFTSLRWMRQGVQQCRGVARIENELGEGVGTGFLVSGRDVHDDWPPLALLTNAHVVPGSVYPEAAVVRFRGAGAAGDEAHAVGSQLWTSPVADLDATILSLDHTPDSVTPAVAAPTLPAPDAVPTPRAFVIGHPEGTAEPMFSLENNLVLDLDDTRLHYSAATAHGSSGSPVYDERWQLIALHHAGGDAMHRLHGQPGTYRANEGISIRRILDAARRSQA
jgi:V8-like Glu-specific endopeptidase